MLFEWHVISARYRATTAKKIDDVRAVIDGNEEASQFQEANCPPCLLFCCYWILFFSFQP